MCFDDALDGFDAYLKANRGLSANTRRESARPGPVVYVPVDDMDEQPVQKKKGSKKKHKGGRIFGLLLLMVLVVGGCAYAGASYYFSDRFFEGTWINGVNCSRMTAYEVENLFKQKFQNYSIEVSSRGLDPQTIAGDQIDYQYLSTGEVLNLLKQQKASNNGCKIGNVTRNAAGRGASRSPALQGLSEKPGHNRLVGLLRRC